MKNKIVEINDIEAKKLTDEVKAILNKMKETKGLNSLEYTYGSAFKTFDRLADKWKDEIICSIYEPKYKECYLCFDYNDMVDKCNRNTKYKFELEFRSELQNSWENFINNLSEDSIKNSLKKASQYVKLIDIINNYHKYNDDRYFDDGYFDHNFLVDIDSKRFNKMKEDAYKSELMRSINAIVEIFDLQNYFDNIECDHIKEKIAEAYKEKVQDIYDFLEGARYMENLRIQHYLVTGVY